MFDVASRKLGLEAAVLGLDRSASGKALENADGDWDKKMKLTPVELGKLLKVGAYELFKSTEQVCDANALSRSQLCTQ